MESAPPKKSRARRCAFCCKEKRTREHILGDWLAKYFPVSGKNAVATITRQDGSSFSFPTNAFEQKVKVVCETCNTGWMSALEGRVKPFLGQMIRAAVPTTLDNSRQRILATWAVKTAFMFDKIHTATPVVPESEYHRLYVAQQPPSGYVVWIGFRADLRNGAGQDELAAAKQQVVPYTRIDPTLAPVFEKLVAAGHVQFRVTFTVGHVVFVVYGHNFPGTFHIELSKPLNNLVSSIWPPIGIVQWPPIGVDIIGGWNALHDRFQMGGPDVAA